MDPIPAPIAAAICQIKAKVEAIKKSQRNSHGSYMFASTDDIYAATTRRMGEVGLLILPLEIQHEIKRVEKTDKGGQLVVSQWLAVTYQMVIAASDGSTWTDKACARSLYVQYTGPQTHQSAESYAKKQFLRSLFQLPTGDVDLDAMPQADTEEAQIALTTPRKRLSSSAAKKDGQSEKFFNEVRRAFSECISGEMLRHVRETYAEGIAALPERWASLLSEEFEDKMLSFGAFRDAAE